MVQRQKLIAKANDSDEFRGCADAVRRASHSVSLMLARSEDDDLLEPKVETMGIEELEETATRFVRLYGEYNSINQ